MNLRSRVRNSSASSNITQKIVDGEDEKKEKNLKLPNYVILFVLLCLFISVLFHRDQNQKDDSLLVVNRKLDSKTKELKKGNKESLGYHLVFSTDCSPYQHWQSYLLFFQQ